MYLTNSIEWVASREVARSCMYVLYICTIQSANSIILSEGKCCILIYANEAFGRSEMLTIIHLAHKLCLSASVHAFPPAPTPYTTHSMSIRFESESKANENERRRMQEMPHYTSTWIGCHVRPNKQRNWFGDQLLHKAKTSASLKKRSFATQSITRA